VESFRGGIEVVGISLRGEREENKQSGENIPEITRARSSPIFADSD